MKTVSYKGYQASVEYEEGVLFVKVLHLDDLLVGQCDNAGDVQGVLADLVDNYISDCRALGKEPTKPFSGTFNVRLGPELHRLAAIAASGEGRTLNAWITKAVEEKLECSTLTSRVEGIIGAGRIEVQAVRLAQSIALDTYSTGNFSRSVGQIDFDLVVETPKSRSEWTN